MASQHSKGQKTPPLVAALITMGIVFLLAALFANFYEVEPATYFGSPYPFRDYTFPLAILGFACVLGGVAAHFTTIERA